MNLARLTYNIGNSEEAKLALLRVLEFNPDLPEARHLLRALESSTAACPLH